MAKVDVKSNIKELSAEYFDWSLQDFQLEILQAMFEGGYLCVNVPTDHPAADTTVVPTVEGWKYHGDLGPGDVVFGVDGKPTLITARSPTTKLDRKVFFSDGSSVVCGQHHLWTVWARGTQVRTYSTAELADKKLREFYNGNPVYKLPRASALQLRRIDLPIDPYTLGLWLGDGGSTGASIFGCEHDLDVMCSHIPYSLGRRYTDTRSGAQVQGILGLRTLLRVNNLLGNKHIPSIYFRAAEEQRRELLRGLVDSDGHVNAKFRVVFVNKNKHLAEQVLQLARGLGYRGSMYQRSLPPDHWVQNKLVHSTEPSWNVEWSIDDGKPQGKLARKAVTRTITRNRVGILAIEPTSPEDGHCIQVARQDGLYLVGDTLLSSHNSKSTMGAFLFPLLSLMENPNETHIICGANINDSKRRVQTMQREIETNHQLVEDFPWIAKPEEKESRIWSNIQFNVVGRTLNKPNPSVIAAAIGSADIKGRRGKLIMDDIEGLDARYSPLKREQTYEWVKTEAWRCFEDKRETDRPLLCLLGTPFDIDSLYFRVEQEGWKVIRYPAYREGSFAPVADAHGYIKEGLPIYLWPDKADKVERARKRLKKWQFSVAYLMDPTGGDQTRLSAAEIQSATQEAEFRAKDYTGFVALDPASGSDNKRADYAGISVLKINWPFGEELPQVEVQEAHAFTQGLFEQIHFCADLASKYGYPVIYETNSQQGGTYQSAFQHLHPEVALLRHFTTQANKFDTSMGLSVVKTLVVKKRLHVPESELESDGIQNLVQELRDLKPPFNMHDHICASIWFAVRYAYQQARNSKVAPIQSSYFAPTRPNQSARFQVGFRSAQANERERLIEQEQQKEIDRFRQALNGSRGGQVG